MLIKNVKDLLNYFYREWRKKYGSSYPSNYAKHGAMFKRLTSAGHELGSLRRYIDLYLRSTDSFTVSAGHTIEIFNSKIPSLVAGAKAEDARRAAVTENLNPDYVALEAARKKQ